jgi:hypothetical protein
MSIGKVAPSQKEIRSLFAKQRKNCSEYAKEFENKTKNRGRTTTFSSSIQLVFQNAIWRIG